MVLQLRENNLHIYKKKIINGFVNKKKEIIIEKIHEKLLSEILQYTIYQHVPKIIIIRVTITLSPVPICPRKMSSFLQLYKFLIHN